MTGEIKDYGNGVLRAPLQTNDDFATRLSKYLSENPNKQVHFITDSDFYGRIVIIRDKQEGSGV